MFPNGAEAINPDSEAGKPTSNEELTNTVNLLFDFLVSPPGFLDSAVRRGCGVVKQALTEGKISVTGDFRFYLSTERILRCTSFAPIAINNTNVIPTLFFYPAIINNLPARTAQGFFVYAISLAGSWLRGEYVDKRSVMLREAFERQLAYYDRCGLNTTLEPKAWIKDPKEVSEGITFNLSVLLSIANGKVDLGNQILKAYKNRDREPDHWKASVKKILGIPSPELDADFMSIRLVVDRLNDRQSVERRTLQAQLEAEQIQAIVKSKTRSVIFKPSWIQEALDRLIKIMEDSDSLEFQKSKIVALTMIAKQLKANSHLPNGLTDSEVEQQVAKQIAELLLRPLINQIGNFHYLEESRWN